MFARDGSRPARSEARGRGWGRGFCGKTTFKPPVAQRVGGISSSSSNIILLYLCMAYVDIALVQNGISPFISPQLRTCLININVYRRCTAACFEQPYVDVFPDRCTPQCYYLLRETKQIGVYLQGKGCAPPFAYSTPR